LLAREAKPGVWCRIIGLDSLEAAARIRFRILLCDLAGRDKKSTRRAGVAGWCGGLVWLSWKGVLSCLRRPLCLLGEILLGKVRLDFALVLKIYEEEDYKCIVLEC
jgi:hypothetical protein